MILSILLSQYINLIIYQFDADECLQPMFIQSEFMSVNESTVNESTNLCVGYTTKNKNYCACLSNAVVVLNLTPLRKNDFNSTQCTKY